MKKIITIFLLVASISSYGQKKEDSTYSKIDTTYQLNLTKTEISNIINAIRSLDEKPSVINKFLEENIFKKIKMIPTKEKLKK